MEEYGNLTSGSEGARDKDLTMSGGLVCNRGDNASWVTALGISQKCIMIDKWKSEENPRAGTI